MLGCPVHASAVNYIRLGNGDNALLAGNDHIVIAAGTVDDENIAVLIPSGHDANVFVIEIAIRVMGSFHIGRYIFEDNQWEVSARLLP